MRRVCRFAARLSRYAVGGMLFTQSLGYPPIGAGFGRRMAARGAARREIAVCVTRGENTCGRDCHDDLAQLPAEVSGFQGPDAIGEAARLLEELGFAAGLVTHDPCRHRALVGQLRPPRPRPVCTAEPRCRRDPQAEAPYGILVLPVSQSFPHGPCGLEPRRLSEGRVILGVAAGYLRSEFNALGVQFRTAQRAYGRSICRPRQHGVPRSSVSRAGVTGLPTRHLRTRRSHRIRPSGWAGNSLGPFGGPWRLASPGTRLYPGRVQHRLQSPRHHRGRRAAEAHAVHARPMSRRSAASARPKSR